MPSKKWELQIACVGKPSSGKSTFFNASSYTKKKAKTGAHPFTTIDPNEGLTYFKCCCPCKRLNVKCESTYGCINGMRQLPIKLLDVAGLIPGASLGRGLGNKFLDDLRQADALMHIIDVSGTTDRNGEACDDHDPSKDVKWLIDELHLWIFNNLWGKWNTTIRKFESFVAHKNPISTTEILLKQLSGYGANYSLVDNVLRNVNLSDTNLSKWDVSQVHQFVTSFIDERFKMIFVLNKSDKSGEKCDKYMSKIFDIYDANICVPSSSLMECFLLRAKQNGYIDYIPGNASFRILNTKNRDKISSKLLKQLEKAQTYLFRFGGTGVWEAVSKCVMLCDPIVVFPVQNLNSYLDLNHKRLGTALICRRNTSIRTLGNLLYDDEVGENSSVIAEGEDGRRLAEHDSLQNHMIIKVTKSHINSNP